MHLKVNKGTGSDEVLPILWTDNYFMLLPGESRQIRAGFSMADLGKATPAIAVDCFNAGSSSAQKNAVPPEEYLKYH